MWSAFPPSACASPLAAVDDYFDGPGEESWAPLVPGDEPDSWWDVPGGWPAVDPDAGFEPGGSAEVMPAGVPLHLRVEQAVADGLAGMSDDAVVGVVAAARRLRARAEWLELKATQEFARRRWESTPAPQRDKGGRWRFKGQAAEFAADELAFELADSPLAAQERMDLALALRDRLPAMAARLAAGRGDAHRCQIVHDATAHLSDEDARQADAELAGEAPGLRYDALRRRARKLAIRLDPDSERQRKERATREKARVEAFGERSGNYALAGRELPVEEVLASRAHIRGLAQELRARGVPGSLRELELMCYLDLTQGRDPRDRIPGRRGSGDPGTPAPGESRGDQANDGEPGGAAGSGSPWPFSPPGSGGPGGRAPLPARINLLVPVGTLLGWSAMPGEAGRDIIDPKTLRDLVRAASRHPATRWCVTIVGGDQTAAAHGCARGQHPWDDEGAITTQSRWLPGSIVEQCGTSASCSVPRCPAEASGLRVGPPAATSSPGGSPSAFRGQYWRRPCGRAWRFAGCAVATITVVEMRAFETVDQAASSAVAMLQDGERLSRLWRYVFVQMLDDYTSALRHAGVAAAARMWASAPRNTGDIRVDAAFAAMAEYLARRDGWDVPSWARLPQREAWPWWFVTDLRGLHPRALVESPSSFRRRGVFITSGALDRA